MDHSQRPKTEMNNQRNNDEKRRYWKLSLTCSEVALYVVVDFVTATTNSNPAVRQESFLVWAQGRRPMPPRLSANDVEKNGVFWKSPIAGVSRLDINRIGRFAQNLRWTMGAKLNFTRSWEAPVASALTRPNLFEDFAMWLYPNHDVSPGSTPLSRISKR